MLENTLKTKISQASRFLSAAIHIPTMQSDIRATIPYISNIFLCLLPFRYIPMFKSYHKLLCISILLFK